MNTIEWLNYLNKYETIDPKDLQTFKDLNLTKKNIAVLIEPRKHVFLGRVFNNFYSKLITKDFFFVIAHGTENIDDVTSLSNSLPHVDLWNLKVNNLQTHEYNNLLCSEHFWNHFKHEYNAERVLIFQTDTLLLKNNIEDFIDFDYIGAPWYRDWLPGTFVGNGGLSLRKIDVMLDVLKKYPRISCGNMNEDVYFSHYARNLGHKVPNVETAKKFASETVVSEDPMGLHNTWEVPFQKIKHKLL